MKKIVLTLTCLIVFSTTTHAQYRDREASREGRTRLTYDLGASTGSYGGSSYTEINLGLNWYVQEWMNWRNAVFQRMISGGESSSGLDSSLRFEYRTQGDNVGLMAFAGPGYRFSSKSTSAAFAEAGLVFKLGGLSIGGGAKVMNYMNPGTDSLNRDLPRQDTTYFLILGGSGSL